MKLKELEEKYYNKLKIEGYSLLPIEEFRKSAISVVTQLAVIESLDDKKVRNLGF